MEYAKNEFNTETLKAEEAEKIINGLSTLFERIYFSDDELDELSETIWIRPTKGNIPVFDEIMENETEITGLEMSVYIRGLLNEYSRLPRYKKEQIVFTEECSITLCARDNEKILKFRYEGELHRAFVFSCVYNYLEEQGNFFLCFDIGKNIICRYQISEVDALHVLDKKYNPSDAILKLCQKYYDDGMWINDEIIEIGDNV